MVYKTVGTCSREIHVELDGDTIKNIEIIGGCDGNLHGLSALLAGTSADEAIKRLRGIDCHGKGTSCPDQISLALEQALRETA